MYKVIDLDEEVLGTYSSLEAAMEAVNENSYAQWVEDQNGEIVFDKPRDGVYLVGPATQVEGVCQENYKNNMKKVIAEGLDQIYLELKSISDTLKVSGYASHFEGVSYNQSDSLLGWFIKFMPALKVGIENLLVASAFGSSEGYSLYEDSVFMSTQPTNFGLLVELNVHRYYEECETFADPSYEKQKTFFLLEYKKNSQFL